MDANGWAFISGLEQVFALQPVIACAECVDEFASRAHFKLVHCVATAFGYKTLWAQIVPYHELSNHCRSRWLCVWLRADVAAEPIGFSLPCSVTPRVPWNDECYKFSLPKVWQDQVRLSQSEAAIYNDLQLIPPAKRAKVSSLSRPDAGLFGRLACPHEPLPTLCASYTTQHALSHAHLQSKGIFVVLTHHNGSYCFLDPAHFCSLFGATRDLILPSKVSLAFKVVGNAITVPHSILCIAVGLYAILPEAINPISIMRDAWDHRLTAKNAVLIEQGSFVRLMPVSLVRQLLHTKVIGHEQGEWRVIILFHGDDEEFERRATMAMTFAEVLSSMFQGPDELFPQCSLHSEVRACDLTCSIREIAAIADDWTLRLGNVGIANCRLILQPELTEKPSEIHATNWPATVPCVDLTSSTVELCPPGPLEAFGSCATFASILDAMHPIEFVKGPVWFKAVVVHHALPGALQIRRNQANFEALLPALRNLLKPNEQLATTLAFDSAARDTAAFRIIHIFKISSAIGEVAITAHIPSEELVIHAVVDSTDGSLPTFALNQSLYQIEEINGSPRIQHVGSLQPGALLQLTRSPDIKAGGHHLSSGATPTLRAGSNFQARAEYMCNTHGWIAADELWSITQNILFMQDSFKFTAPVYWNQADSDFTLSPFGELYLYNNTTNVICVLIDDHWAAIEICRNADAAHLTFVQLPQHLHSAATFVVARLLDIAPHRLTSSSEHEEHLPHLCGWRLVQRWIHRFDIEDNFQPETFAGVADRFHDIINMTMECALEDLPNLQCPSAAGSSGKFAAEEIPDLPCSQRIAAEPSATERAYRCLPGSTPTVVFYSAYASPFARRSGI